MGSEMCIRDRSFILHPYRPHELWGKVATGFTSQILHDTMTKDVSSRSCSFSGNSDASMMLMAAVCRYAGAGNPDFIEPYKLPVRAWSLGNFSLTYRDAFERSPLFILAREQPGLGLWLGLGQVSALLSVVRAIFFWRSITLTFFCKGSFAFVTRCWG